MTEHLFSVWGMLIVGTVCLALVAIADNVAKAWRRARADELDASLKGEMIRQGRSAEEIERILKAGGPAAAAPEE